MQALKDVIASVVLVAVASFLASLVADSRVGLAAGLFVGLRCGWFEGSAAANAVTIIVLIVAEWLLILQFFVEPGPTGLVEAVIVSVGTWVIGYAFARGVRRTRLDGRSQP